MSRFLSQAASQLSPYTPGEQPQDMRYIKLNTNENPYPPSPEVVAAIRSFDAHSLRLYPDPTAAEFRAAMADDYGLKPEQVFAGAGSDEVLGYAFMAFHDRGDKVYFPDITYGFYQVYADLCGLCATKIPLREDFTIDVEDYFGLDGSIFIANPNAPTGICLSTDEIRQILQQNRDRLVVIDEAYIDFARGGSCVKLIHEYDNLLVVQTFSKSRSLAGMRLGAGFGNAELMRGLERIKYSFNPYNLDRIALAAGIAAIKNASNMRETAARIIKNREHMRARLEHLGFTVLPSEANFLFCKNDAVSGKDLYEKLKQNGVLVRHFGTDRIKDFIRVTVGDEDETEQFLSRLEGLL